MSTPTTDRPAAALEADGAPAEMVSRAREGYYDDYKSPLAMPEMQLLHDACAAGLVSIADRVLNGEWEATRGEESDEWAASPEGQATFRALLDPRPNRAERRHPKR